MSVDAAPPWEGMAKTARPAYRMHSSLGSDNCLREL